MRDKRLTTEEICRLCPDDKECGNRGTKCNYIALKFIAQAQLAKCEASEAQRIAEAVNEAENKMVNEIQGTLKEMLDHEKQAVKEAERKLIEEITEIAEICYSFKCKHKTEDCTLMTETCGAWQQIKGGDKVKMAELIIQISLDGNKYCALVGDNLQEGLAGFGDRPIDALRELTAEIGIHGWNLDNFSLFDQ